MKTPEIRFKGFENEWEEKKLNSITDVRDGTHDSPRYVQNGHPFITSKNVRDGFLNFDEIQYISNKDFEKINERSKVDINDILMGMIGTIGNIALVRKEPDFAIKNVALIKDTGEVSYLYLYQALQSNSITNQLAKSLDGGTQNFIALNKVRDLSIPLPCNKEQEKIGSFFQMLDERLEIEKKKYQKLKDFKKSMLEGMFPKDGETVQEIRFDGFEDEWELIRVEELLSYEQPGEYIVKSDEYVESGTPVLTANKAFVLGYTRENNIYSKGKCIILDDFTMDMKYVDFPFMVKSSAIKILTDFKDNLYFLYTYLLSLNLQAEQHQRHYISYIQKLKLAIPSLEEQKLIGDFFKNLDEKIEVAELKIEKIENFKKSLMEKMFV